MPHMRRSGLSKLRSGALVLALIGAWLTPVATAPAARATTRVTFHYTGAARAWIVPAGVTRASFEVYGAQGGGEDVLGLPIIKGGKGGHTSAKIDVTPGEVIYIFVGGKGHDGGTFLGLPSRHHFRGGFNGGGNGGFNPRNHLGSGGGGGGGASDIRVGGKHLTNRVIVAGGGGGSSERLSTCGLSVGGGGGGLKGANGVAAFVPSCIGGSGGDQLGQSGSGMLGFGGNGKPPFAALAGGGGGGGGYYGGGGGSVVAGGGGGSGFGPKDTRFATGVRAGNGMVTVTGDDPPRLTLVKHVDNGDAGGTATDRSWVLQASGPSDISGRTRDPEITRAQVEVGTYRLSEESGPAGYSASFWSCRGAAIARNVIRLAEGDRVVCQITNTAIAPRMTLIKQVDNGTGGSAGPDAWILTAAGPVTISGRTGQRVITNAPVKTGVYRLSEASGPPDYAASAWSCDTGIVVGDSLHLPLGVHATCTITNTYQKATPTLTTRAAGSGHVGALLFDEATLSGGRDHTGTITFRLYGPNDSDCTSPALETSEVTVTPDRNHYQSGQTHPITRAGVYRYVASYSGDRNNGPIGGSCGGPGESATVASQTPRITTIATGGVAGGTVRDTARLTGHPHVPITGDVRFVLYGSGDHDCATPLSTSTGAVLNGSVSSGPVAVTAAGTYRWIATYTGDANNTAVSSACADEPVTVRKASPSISTTPSANVDAGAAVLDAATLAGGYQLTGTVVFVLYGADDPTCTGTPAAVRTGSVSDGSAGSGGVQVTQAGTHHWVATYRGDHNNTEAQSSCADEAVTVRPGLLARLALAPAAATVHAGSSQGYTATGYDPYGNLIGDVTGQTTFTIDGGGACQANSCTGSVGTHTVTGTDQSVSGTATLLVSTVAQPPAITSAAGGTVVAGQAGSFEISATGLPTPSLTTSGRLPAGMRFDDHGNGTATLSGIPAAGTGGAYSLMVNATNGVSPSATQSFVLIVKAPVLALRQTSSSTTVTAGQTVTFTLETSNHNGITLQHVRTCDALPGELIYLSASPRAGLSVGRYCWTAASLANGHAKTYTITAQVPLGVTGTATSQATATATGVTVTHANATIHIAPNPPGPCPPASDRRSSAHAAC